MYKLVISPSPFRATYIHKKLYKYYFIAYFVAWWMVVSNPYVEIYIQKDNKK